MSHFVSAALERGQMQGPLLLKHQCLENDWASCGEGKQGTTQTKGWREWGEGDAL